MAIQYPVLRPMKIRGIDVNVSIVAMVMFWASCGRRYTEMFILLIYKYRKGAFVKFHIWFYKHGISSLGKPLMEC